MEEDKNTMGVPLKRTVRCNKCRHLFATKSKLEFTTCNSCMNKIKIEDCLIKQCIICEKPVIRTLRATCSKACAREYNHRLNKIKRKRLDREFNNLTFDPVQGKLVPAPPQNETKN